jgi:hypothetical protein
MKGGRVGFTRTTKSEPPGAEEPVACKGRAECTSGRSHLALFELLLICRHACMQDGLGRPLAADPLLTRALSLGLSSLTSVMVALKQQQQQQQQQQQVVPWRDSHLTRWLKEVMVTSRRVLFIATVAPGPEVCLAVSKRNLADGKCLGSWGDSAACQHGEQMSNSDLSLTRTGCCRHSCDTELCVQVPDGRAGHRHGGLSLLGPPRGTAAAACCGAEPWQKQARGAKV